MNQKEFGKFKDSYHEIDRVKIRFNGTGPRLHDDTNKIWPRDAINPEDESKKIVYHELTLMINDEERVANIRSLIVQVFQGLRRCNVQKLFNKFCPLDPGYFNRVQFDVHYALDAHNSYEQILAFIHQVLRSINAYERSEDVIKKLFGSHKNFSTYKGHIRWLVQGNRKLRRISVADLMLKGKSAIDLEAVSWLKGLDHEVRCRIFMQLIFALTRFLTELIRRYFYVTISNPYSNKIFYFRYDLWQKIQNTEIQRLVSRRVLCRFQLEDSIDLPVNEVSKLKFYLKKDGLRLICTRQKNNECRKRIYQLQAVFSFVLSKLENFKKFTLDDLLQGLKYFQLKARQEGKKVHIVRADIKDCFQSIEQILLRNIIIKILRDNTYDGHIEFNKLACTLKPNRLKNRRTREIQRWTVDVERIKASGEYECVYLSDGPIYMSIEDFDSKFLRPHLVNPLLRESRQSKFGYNLMEGLRQGSSFSPMLSSIYIQTAFNENLKDMIESDDCEIYRYVDDILFISTDETKSKLFMHRMLRGFKKFNLRMNIDKLACNFEFPRPDVGKDLCRLGDFAVFYKRCIAQDTLQCSYDFNNNGIGLYNTFHASPYIDKCTIKSTISRLFRIELIHLDYDLNGFELVLRNIFEHAALMAHRIATMILLSFELRQTQDPRFLVDLMKIVSKKMIKTMIFGCEKNLIVNRLTYFEVRLVIVAAFYATWCREQIRHRIKERDRILHRLERYKMKYLVLVDDDTNESTYGTPRGVQFEKEIKRLMDKFTKSSFVNEIILPCK